MVSRIRKLIFIHLPPPTPPVLNRVKLVCATASIQSRLPGTTPLVNKFEWFSERLGDYWPLYFDMGLRNRTWTWKFVRGEGDGRAGVLIYLYFPNIEDKITLHTKKLAS